MGRHAEIAGAGFAGLTLAALLADHGWTVRVHERAEAVREIGSGIFLHNNGLAVVEELGLMGVLAGRGVELSGERMKNGKGKLLKERQLSGASRVWSFPRLALVEELHRAAIARGVELVTSSEVIGATPDGILRIAGGEEVKADLAVGADGHRSVVRDSLGLTREQRRLNSVSTRYLLPGRNLAPEDMTTEYWSGRRRLAIAACAPDLTYVYMACLERDAAATLLPIDVHAWSKSFPSLLPAFEVFREAEPYRTNYTLVRCSSWSAGATVLLGDAAHALAPTLGQGTNLAMTNARSLVTYLDHYSDIRTALSSWEHAVRPVTDATQAWASRYDRVTKYWPEPIAPVRAGVIWAFSAVPALNARMRIADRTLPIMHVPKVKAD